MRTEAPAPKSTTDIREDLVRALEAQLVGPFDRVSGQETLPIPPSRFYLAGYLAPQGARVRDADSEADDDDNDPTSHEELAAGDDADDGEHAAPDAPPKSRARRSFLPVSMGMSVLLPPGDGGTITATVRWADYTAVEAAAPPEADAQVGRSRKTPQGRLEWLRVAKVPSVVMVPLDAGKLEAGIDVPNSGGLQLQGKLAAGDAPGLVAGTRALSLFLVNRRAPQEKRDADLAFAFQVSLELSFDTGLVGRPNRQHEDAQDVDDRIADLQYRHHVEHAVGHGTAVHVSKDEDGIVRRALTTWLPRVEVRRVDSHDSKLIESRMAVLAELGDAPAIDAALYALPVEYAAWIAAQASIDVDSDTRKTTRDELLREAARAKDRIIGGIELLKTDATVRNAFCTMNRAMAMQQRQRARTDSDKNREPKWRLFQLAFVLMNLPSIADPHHDDRNTAELIFFPTGGGKTEAYLGVIAFTLVLRRLRRRHLPDEGLGTAVILRYTLRLLTLDQLSRAATLMCALEVLRRDRTADLGTERFAVGLWVGRKATANTLSEVAKKIVDYKGSTSVNAPSPCPLTECPWCQTAIAKASFELRPKPSAPEEVIVACVNAECPFTARRSMSRGVPQGMPVLFVDEQIYRELPAFLVSTVDKFALLPWRGETGKLFGRVSAREHDRCFGPTDGAAPKTATPLPEGLARPELIVQDELHLISGPLGTMVGLYETVVEQLSMAIIDDKPVKPKLLASTATVKRAREQIRGLFGRSDTAIFPPPGVDAQETFFSKVDTKSDGRLYVGIAAPGRASKAVMHDVYNTLLGSAAKAHHDADGKRLGTVSPADTYMTLVGYFNALRELGGMRRLVEDTVHSRVRQIEDRHPRDWLGSHPWAKNREIGQPVELTSRERTSEIARVKDRMSRAHTTPERVDVVLASNMISVGVDIERLGLMVVAGQPKSTNEYIQATSRVGRKMPGLVVTVFNTVKPRDRSHYERFGAYHEAFYRAVEATSVTPFSGPALQRGLAGVVVALARHGTAALTPSGAAMAIAANRTSIELLIDKLADRAAAERTGTSAADAEKIKTTMRSRGRNIVDAWESIMLQANQAGADRCYSPWDPGKRGKALLFQATDDAETFDAHELKFAAPTSMRDVEGSVHLWVKRGPLGGRRPG
jgi:hypothetical protein